MGKVKYVCYDCRSEEVSIDAYAEWDKEAQRWVLGDMYDYTYCHECEGETVLDEEPIEEIKSTKIETSLILTSKNQQDENK